MSKFLTLAVVVIGIVIGVHAFLSRSGEVATLAIPAKPDSSHEWNRPPSRIDQLGQIPGEIPGTEIVGERRFAARILESAMLHHDSSRVATLLKAMEQEDPEQLGDALLALGNSDFDTRRLVLPMLAGALTLWPDADGCYVFPVADAFSLTDLPAAAEWGAAYLTQTGRTDLAVSSILARLAETDEDSSLRLIGSIPEAAQKAALNSLACHIQVKDLDHLLNLCRRIDPDGSMSFSKPLFDRLGLEQLDETAAMLARSPESQGLLGGIASIGQAWVRSGNPGKAIVWADALGDHIARAQAITAVYQEWSRDDPEAAIRDILNQYDGAPQLMTDVFKGASEHHGSGAVSYWESASHLDNASARSYAVSSLITPTLMTVGLAETKSKIDALPQGSLERAVAERTLLAELNNPGVAYRIEGNHPDVFPGTSGAYR